MPVSVKNLSSIFGKDVFTNKGIYCGRVADLKLNLQKFRVQSIFLDVAKGSFLSNLIGSKKGIVVPYSQVESVGDILIIKHISSPDLQEETVEEKTGTEPQPFSNLF